MDVSFYLLFCLVLAVLFVRASVRICSEWERKVVLFLGRFNGVRGPGLFLLLPYLEKTPFTVDVRTVTSSITAEQTLTHDNVPVNVDIVVYWQVVDPEKAVLQVVDYTNAVVSAAQTALRDIIGRSNLSQVLSDRAGLDRAMTETLDVQTAPWGIKVHSVQMREMKIPDNLQDAMSRVAQADREGKARMLLGQSEVDIAARFADAGKIYEKNPMALHLRGMNMLYEVMKTGGTATVIVPSDAVKSMSFGGMAGFAALAGQTQAAEQAQAHPAPPYSPDTPASGLPPV